MTDPGEESSRAGGPSTLQRVQGVSFPRSGHALLTGCLQQYFGSRLVYCHDVRRRIDFAEAVNYQKNHDFDLRLPNDPSRRHLIQYRHPLESLTSWYLWEVHHGVKAEQNTTLRRRVNRCLPVWNLYTRRETRRRWLSFLDERLACWRAFVRKWVLDNRNPNTIVVPYGALVQDTVHVLTEVVTFVDPARPPEPLRIASIVQRHDIRPRSRVRTFRHFDPEFFRNLEASVQAELIALGIEPLFS